MEYKLVDSKEKNEKEFQKDVNKHLKNGWNLFGPPAFVDTNIDGGYLLIIQAMTKG